MAHTYDRRRTAYKTNAPDADALRAMLLKIDTGDYHTVPKKGLTKADRVLIDELEAQGMIRMVGAKGSRFPAHYVLTNRGIHGLGTFKGIMAGRRVLARFLGLDRR